MCDSTQKPIAAYRNKKARVRGSCFDINTKEGMNVITLKLLYFTSEQLSLYVQLGTSETHAIFLPNSSLNSFSNEAN